MPYPVVRAESDWGPPADIVDGAVAPPTADRGPYDYTPQNCDSVSKKKHSQVLARILRKNGYSKPEQLFQAHHIKEVCWHGTDELSNGIWVPGRPSDPDLHQNLTTWRIANSNFAP